MKIDSELAASMASLLDPKMSKQASDTNNVQDALNSLGKSAEILDNLGLYVMAEAATKLMERIPTSLKKKAQRHGFGELKYLMETLSDSLAAVRSKLSDLYNQKPERGKRYPSADQLQESSTWDPFEKHFNKLEEVNEVIGEVQGQIETGEFVDLDYNQLLDSLMSHSAYVASLAGKLFKDGYPTSVERLLEVNKVWSQLSENGMSQEDMKEFADHLESFMSYDEEREGRDYSEPTLEFERYKDHVHHPNPQESLFDDEDYDEDDWLANPNHHDHPDQPYNQP